MAMKNTMRIVAAMALASLGLISCAKRAPQTPRGPVNILLISIDTLRPDALGCYGRQGAQTPAIDALASSGALFEKAFAHAPLTLPSHASLLAGTLPPVHGVHDNMGFRVPEEPVMMAEHLKSRGFRTAAFVGGYPLDSSFGIGQGFDLYDDFYGVKSRGSGLLFVERRAEETVARCLEWLGRDSTDGWFVFLHLFDPHQPYAPPEPYAERYARDPYAGEVAYVDDCLGRLFRFLGERGLDGKTLVVLTSDHGESLGEHGESTHGYFAYNSTLHVPLVIRPPRFAGKGMRRRETVSHIDIYPTVCSLLGIPAPAGLPGRSLAPLLEGGRIPEGTVYFESLAPYYLNGWAPLRGVMEGQYKYIDLPVPELYDLASDFSERDNLASTRPLDPFRAALGRFTTLAPAGLTPDAKPASRETLEKMKSLGYLTGGGRPGKAEFTARDDLKTNLPYYQQLMTAIDRAGEGDVRGAVSILEDLVRKKSDFAAAVEYLSMVYSDEGNLDKATEVLRTGLAQAPENGRLRGLLGLALSRLGDQEAAIGEIRRSLARNPGDAELWNNLGVAYWKSGQLGPAEESYLKALALDESGADILGNLGTLCFSRGERARAGEYFDRALAYDPGLASAWNGKGAVLADGNDLAGAVEIWRKAVALEPDHELALYNLGTGLLRLGRAEEALPFLERYLAAAQAGSEDRAKIAEIVRALKERR